MQGYICDVCGKQVTAAVYVITVVSPRDGSLIRPPDHLHYSCVSRWGDDAYPAAVQPDPTAHTETAGSDDSE